MVSSSDMRTSNLDRERQPKSGVAEAFDNRT
jgi:hypothetical protein